MYLKNDLPGAKFYKQFNMSIHKYIYSCTYSIESKLLRSHNLLIVPHTLYSGHTHHLSLLMAS